MERRTLIKKLIVYTLLFILLAVLAFFGYIRYGGYLLTDKESRNNIISEIKAAPQLPDNFMTVYNDVYPDGLNKSGWKYVFNRIPFSERYAYSPSMEIAYQCGASRLHGAFFYIEQLNFVIEDNANPQQCLNKYLENVHFRGPIGVEEAAQTYFNKPLDELNEDEVLEILARLTNPTLYNKKRRPQLFQDRFNTLKSKLEKNRAAK
jgi:hypothetical protein